MTIGIVLVASFAARIAGGVEATRTSTLSCTSSATRLGITIPLSLKGAIFNQDIFALNITEIPQPLSECFVRRIEIAGIASRYKVSYPRKFLWLLRLG